VKPRNLRHRQDPEIRHSIRLDKPAKKLTSLPIGTPKQYHPSLSSSPAFIIRKNPSSRLHSQIISRTEIDQLQLAFVNYAHSSIVSTERPVLALRDIEIPIPISHHISGLLYRLAAKSSASPGLGESSGSMCASANTSDFIIDLSEYEEVQVLGEGGFGIVHLVRHRTTGKERAVKSIFADRGEFESEKIVREVGILVSLRHPCIVKTYGWALPTEYMMARIATKYVRNGSLEEVLRDVNDGKIPDFWTHTKITIMILGLVYGMMHVHGRRIIHGDLKPGNILLDDDHRIRICDFGNSKFEASRTATKQSLSTFTPSYAAPELLFEGRVTEKTDVFAFGLILYEILVGKSVFPKTDLRSVVGMHNDHSRPEIPNTVRGRVANLIKKCWSPDPSERLTFPEIYGQLYDLQFAVFADVDMTEINKFNGEIKSFIEQTESYRLSPPPARNREEVLGEGTE
jgi:serine/threonine protein kinase